MPIRLSASLDVLGAFEGALGTGEELSGVRLGPSPVRFDGLALGAGCNVTHAVAAAVLVADSIWLCASCSARARRRRGKVSARHDVFEEA